MISQSEQAMELAALLCALEDAECYKPIPESLIEHGRRYIRAGMTEKHCGDCTNDCHSCVVCGTDGYLLHADQILAALRSSATDSAQRLELAVTDEMVTAAMRAFERMSSVLRYREKDKWHSCDIMGMRDALVAALRSSALPETGERIACHDHPTRRCTLGDCCKRDSGAPQPRGESAYINATQPVDSPNTSRPSPDGAGREATIKECAKIADDFAAYEQTVLDRAYADEALSESGRESITVAAGSRQVAAEQIAHDIRALNHPQSDDANREIP
jgi:hypothetical protein